MTNTAAAFICVFALTLFTSTYQAPTITDAKLVGRAFLSKLLRGLTEIVRTEQQCLSYDDTVGVLDTETDTWTVNFGGSDLICYNVNCPEGTAVEEAELNYMLCAGYSCVTAGPRCYVAGGIEEMCGHIPGFNPNPIPATDTIPSLPHCVDFRK